MPQLPQPRPVTLPDLETDETTHAGRTDTGGWCRDKYIKKIILHLIDYLYLKEANCFSRPHRFRLDRVLIFILTALDWNTNRKVQRGFLFLLSCSSWNCAKISWGEFRVSVEQQMSSSARVKIGLFVSEKESLGSQRGSWRSMFSLVKSSLV